MSQQEEQPPSPGARTLDQMIQELEAEIAALKREERRLQARRRLLEARIRRESRA